MYKIDEIKMLRLGQRDENLAREIQMDASEWLELYPGASIQILFRRPGESTITPMITTLIGTTLTWQIHDFEVGKTGVGNAEFRAVDTAGLRRKSRIIPCSIEDTLLGDDETVLYTQDQVDETLAHISEAAQAALAAKASEEAAALSAQEAGESAASAGTAADVAVSARDAAQAAQTAAETAQHQAEAAQSGVHADAEAAEQAKVAAQAAQASAQGAASQASADRTAAESARADAEAAATHAEAVVEGIDQAGADQVAAVTAAGQAQVTAVNQAGTTQVGNVNAAGTTQVNAVQAKGTQVINSIPADYSALTDDVTDLKSTFEQTQAQLINGYIDNSIYVSGATNRIGIILSNSKRCTTQIAYQLIAGDTISVSSIDAGLKYAIAGAKDGAFIYDSSWLTTDTEYTVPTGKDGLYFVNIGRINEEDLSPSEITTLKVKIETFAYSSQIKELQRDISDLQNANNDFITSSPNFANRAEFVENKYMTDAGATGNSSSYYYTNKIPVSEGDVIYVSPSPRYKTAFNGDTVVSATITFPWTVPSGIDGLILTGYMSTIDSLMVSKNKALPYITYGDYINNDYLRIDNKNALNGNNGLTMEAQTLEALTTMELSAYPKGLATHDRLTGYCKFSTLGEIEFGYGYTSNYFVKVDETNIYKYYNGNVVGEPVPHGLTITDYMAFAMIMDDDRVATVTINTTSGSTSITFNLNYSKSGLPFMRSSTTLSNVKLSAISADIRKPIWWFGDSYSSNADERIIGQLNNYNVIDNMLVNAVPGMRSYYNANTGGYNDLVKLLSFAKPKYIIWTLGMNDTEANYKSYLLRVKNICDAFGIVLYAAKVPSVPNIDNTGKAAYIDELGIRAIDWAKAVNATAQGVWYAGYLSSDNVHPTIAGAQAMAARTLVDCPAIMQF